jgi:hypothetical protein
MLNKLPEGTILCDDPNMLYIAELVGGQSGLLPKPQLYPAPMDVKQGGGSEHGYYSQWADDEKKMWDYWNILCYNK